MATHVRSMHTRPRAQLHIDPVQLDAIFFTHMHNDHTEGFADLIEQRWMFYGEGPKIDVICSSDVTSALGVTLSCRKFTEHVAGASFTPAKLRSAILRSRPARLAGQQICSTRSRLHRAMNRKSSGPEAM